MTSTKIEFISTKRGGVAALYGGRKYHRKKLYVSGDTFWYCDKKHCKGNFTLNNKNVKTKENPHNILCVANTTKTEFLKNMDKLKDRVSTNFDSVKKQYEDMKSHMDDTGVTLLKDLPAFENVKSALYNGRNKVLGAPKLRCKLPSEVVVPGKFQKMVLADYNDEENRLIIFCTQNTRQKICDFKHILCDGTFKSCPQSFKQLYSVHGFDEETQTVIPLIFAVLVNKKKATYELLFRLIKSQFPLWVPEKVTLDFERAAMKGIQNVFPNIEIKLCYYHFNRSLLRKAKKLKIRSPVKKRHVARCAGLARLPSIFINKGYSYVMKKSPIGTEMEKFNTYFKKQWFDQNDFCKVCCCSDEKKRTTNNLEGWHSKINRFIGRRNPTLAHVLDVLKNEKQIGKQNNKKTKIYEEIDDEIDSTIKQLLRKKISIGHCIETISPFSFNF